MDTLSVRIVAHDLGSGGAARAAARTVDALHAQAAAIGLDLSVRTVAGPRHPLDAGRGYPGGAARLRRRASAVVRRTADRLPWRTASAELHSRADVWTGLGGELTRADIDVVNLHWLGTGTLSVGEIGRLRKPVVMTLHDMWAFCGAEHYTEDDRYLAGYPRRSRPDGESGVDWNRIVWRRKAAAIRRPLHVIAPSRWLAEAAGRSALMSRWPISVVPYAIDPTAWYPEDRAEARQRLGLPTGSPIILFGAVGGTDLRRKGGDLLEEALHRLNATTSGAGVIPPPELVVFGGDRTHREPAGRLPFVVHHLGPVPDDGVLRSVYSAADVMVVPSRQDNLPNTALEAQVCGVPVVAFSIGGLPDIVEDGVSGRLVPPFDSEALASAIHWMLEDADRRRRCGASARSLARDRFDPARIAGLTMQVLRDAATAQGPR